MSDEAGWAVAGGAQKRVCVLGPCFFFALSFISVSLSLFQSFPVACRGVSLFVLVSVHFFAPFFSLSYVLAPCRSACSCCSLAAPFSLRLTLARIFCSFSLLARSVSVCSIPCCCSLHLFFSYRCSVAPSYFFRSVSSLCVALSTSLYISLSLFFCYFDPSPNLSSFGTFQS